MDLDSPELRFFCDAMLGGLARWLRAAGYDALFEHGIDDGVLVEKAAADGRTILSSDGPLFDRNVIRTGKAAALFIPRGLHTGEQLAFTFRALHLRRRPARCMACGGELEELPRYRAMDEVPPLAFRRCEHFWRCRRCQKLLWDGTHWNRIRATLARLDDAIAGPSE